MVAAPFLTVPPGGARPDEAWWLTTADGVRLRAGVWRARDPRGQVVILPGRGEYLEKQALAAAGFLARGLDVVSVDWRGQGLSERLSPMPLHGHVADFADFQADLEGLLADARVTPAAVPRVLYGHSMGGAIALAALGRGEMPVPVHALVMTAPMFGIAMGAVPRLAAWALVEAGAAIGLSQRWPPVREVDKPYVLGRFEGNVLTHDRQLWEWLADTARRHPELHVAMPTIGWLAAARRAMRRLSRAGPPPCPALCLLGTEEAVVDPAAVRRGAVRMGAELRMIEGARHEILAESPALRRLAWEEIDRFLSRVKVLPEHARDPGRARTR